MTSNSFVQPLDVPVAQETLTAIDARPLDLPLSQETLAAINAHLAPLTPQQIIEWAVEHLPGLYQTTAFGLTGLVAIDMLSKLSPPTPPLIFLDTLYHFAETYALVEEVKKRYRRDVHVYKPDGCKDVEAFEAKYGDKPWEKNESVYDWAVKVRRLHKAPLFRSTDRMCRLSLPKERTKN